jgi:heptosyltransferase-3
MNRFHYRVNRKIRNSTMYLMNGLAPESKQYDPVHVLNEQIQRILLVRTTFRIGDSILATPAIFMFRRRFPNARIDFVGGTISKILFENLPIDNHYQITRRFPSAPWKYLTLLNRIRSVGYDLAVELSCSQSALGAFIVGLSGARFRAGRTGRRDRWFNVKLPKPVEDSKYNLLTTLVRPMGLETDVLPSIVLSKSEKDAGRKKISAILENARGPVIGVFVGARKSWGKRWRKENFLELINDLDAHGLKVIVFAGPEEMDLVQFYSRGLRPAIPFVFEPNLRSFASMLYNCHCLITCDNGPMHLACALRVHTIAIFQKPNFQRWGPPPNLATVLYNSEGVMAGDVVRVCLRELDRLRADSLLSA